MTNVRLTIRVRLVRMILVCFAQYIFIIRLNNWRVTPMLELSQVERCMTVLQRTRHRFLATLIS